MAFRVCHHGKRHAIARLQSQESWLVLAQSAERTALMALRERLLDLRTETVGTAELRVKETAAARNLLAALIGAKRGRPTSKAQHVEARRGVRP